MILSSPIDVLYERPDLPRFGLPAALVDAYGADLGFPRPCVFANFVTSVDGVVSLPVAEESGHIISGGSEADRLVMGLLRACADAIVVGAGTFRKARGSLWTPDAIFPRAASLFAETRRQLGLAEIPRLVVVSRSGVLDGSERALADAVIVTTPAGAEAMRARARTARVLVQGSTEVRWAELFATLRAEGLLQLLTEGGPTLFAQLAAERLVHELFVTSSPALFGRFPGDGRKSLVDGATLAPSSLELLSVRRSGSHLLSRYAFRP